MDYEALYARYEAQLEDFWGRRANRPAYHKEFTIFGRPVQLSSNFPAVLASADYARPLYSKASKTEAPPFAVQFIVREEAAGVGPPPQNFFDHIQYSGYGDRLVIDLGPWGLCLVELASTQALAVLAPGLAEQPVLVSRYLLNTVLTNFLIASDYGFLHATGLLKGEQVILLMAPHNSGKSTTAMRLALAGYALLSDSMIFVGGRDADIRLYGFPVGRLKLRPDMVAEFPQLAHLLEAEPARGEIKFAVDLRLLDPGLVHESVVQPAEVHLCLLGQSSRPATRVRPATPPEVMEQVMANSLFYDTIEVWKRNLSRIHSLVDQAYCHHLRVGTDPASVLAAVERL